MDDVIKRRIRAAKSLPMRPAWRRAFGWSVMVLACLWQTQPRARVMADEPKVTQPPSRKARLADMPVTNEKPSGMPAGFENVVAIQVTDIGAVGTRRSSLARELIRAAFFIAAQDELGLAALDPSLGEQIPIGDPPVSFPLEIRTKMTPILGNNNPPGPPIMKQFKFGIELVRPALEGPAFSWIAPEMILPVENWIDELAERLGTMSHESFVEALQKAGFVKQAVSAKTPDNLDETGDHLDFISQFALLRQLHAEMRSQPPTTEILGRLVRAYANLGNLTDYHWNSTSKAFKARSLIYAQRQIDKYGQTPYTLAHRAYALALTGRHASSLIAIQAAKSAKGMPAPQWFPLIEQYCAYKPALLEEYRGPYQELAYYFNMRMSDVRHDQQRTLERIQLFADLNPVSWRAAEILCEMQTLGINSVVTQSGVDLVWPHVYERISELPNLPEAAQEIARKQASTAGDKRKEEYASRAHLIAELRKGSAGDQVRPFPSWSTLGSLLSDESYIQAWRLVESQALFQSINADKTLAELKPVIEGHRLEKFLNCYASDRRKSVNALLEFVWGRDYAKRDQSQAGWRAAMRRGTIPGMDIQNAEPAALPIQFQANRLLDQFSVNLIAQMLFSHADDIYEDMARYQALSVDHSDVRALAAASPHWPRTIVALILQKWDAKKAEEWERNYADFPFVMNNLGKKYVQLFQMKDAIRCLNKSVADSPSYEAYELLAQAYKEEGDLENWQDSLERALQLPSFGLEHAKAESDLAYALMRQGKWQEAEQHADSSAQSYSFFGLSAGARCAEGLQKWDKAENLLKAAAQRYGSDAWYFWCVRTRHKNTDAARVQAERFWATLAPPLDANLMWHLATGMLLAGKTAEARKILVQSFEQNKNLSSATLAAILADQEGDTKERDELFTKLEKHWKLDNGFPELTNLLRGILVDDQGGRWNPMALDQLVLNSNPTSIPYLYLMSGIFLQRHGHKELGLEYLQVAATIFDTDNLACVLATDRLHHLDIEVGPGRLNNMPDHLAEIDRLMKKALRLYEVGKLDESEDLLNRVLNEHPSFAPALIARGNLYERQQKYEAAISKYEEAIRIAPDFKDAYLDLAWLLATCERDDIRNGERALTAAKRAVSLRQFETRHSARVLAAAYAESGIFKEALQIAERMNTMLDPTFDDANRLLLYNSGKPYHRPTAAPATAPANGKP